MKRAKTKEVKSSLIPDYCIFLRINVMILPFLNGLL